MSPLWRERTLLNVGGGEVDEAGEWARARAGDGRSFAALFDRHVDRVFRHVVALVPSSADADEVASAAFFELWRRRDQVRLVQGSVLPWLLVTAGNLARNATRGSRRYAAMIQRLPRSPDLLVGADEQNAEEAERRRALLAGLRRLSPRDAALLTLTALEGFSLSDSADLLDLSVAAARARLLRCRRKLRLLLQEDPRLTLLTEGALQ